MRKLLSVLLAVALLLPSFAANAAEPVQTWADVRAQLDHGAQSVKILNSLVVPEGETLAPSDTLTFEGGGFSLHGGFTVESGTVIFKDTVLEGAAGANGQDGGAALTVAAGAIAVLSGHSSAVGGRSGAGGENGGSAIVLLGDRSGLILRGNARATGGIGVAQGGCGVLAQGCQCSVILTDGASAAGGAALGEGGDGLRAPGCATLSVSSATQMAGGNSVTLGGRALASMACDVCMVSRAVTVSESAVLVGGTGATGGAALCVERTVAGKTPDLTLTDGCMLFGGTGRDAGSALTAACRVAFGGTVQCYAGSYLEGAAAVLELSDTTIVEGRESLTEVEGTKIASDPTSAVASYVYGALQQMDEGGRVAPGESAFAPDGLLTSLGGLRVEKGAVNQLYLNGNGYRLTLWNATYEKKLSFQERLMECDGGVRLVLVAQTSDEYLTLESTTAALKKLQTLGVTELALSMVNPVYYERTLKLAPLLDAIEAYGEDAISRVLIGTADDCVIFRDADGKRDYQENLMAGLVQ